MRFTHSSANSPVIDAFGGLISPPVRMIDALGRSVRSMALALLVITVTSCAVMFEMIDSAVELALMKMQSPSFTCLAAVARNRLIGADLSGTRGPSKRVEQSRRAVLPRKDVLLLQVVEVTSDGQRRDAKVLGEVGHAHLPVALEESNDGIPACGNVCLASLHSVSALNNVALTESIIRSGNVYS